jgi:hypothetical protein
LIECWGLSLLNDGIGCAVWFPMTGYFRQSLGLVAGLCLLVGTQVQTAAAADPATTGTVLVAGRAPGLGSFGQARKRVDLTTAVVTTLGPTSGQPFDSDWTGWRPVSIAEGSTIPLSATVLFAGPEEAASASALADSISAGLAAGAPVVVVPAEPDMRISDIYRLRQAATVAGADFADLGSVAAGRPFEEALESARKLIAARKAAPRLAVSPDRDPVAAGFATPAPARGQQAATRPPAPSGAPVTADFSGENPIVYMAPPPQIRSPSLQRPVPRDPTLRKMPALSN